VGYIPSDAKWYLAEIVEEFSFEGESENVVHTNMVLVRADSPDEAYERTIALGKEREMSYTNPEGTTVTVKFRGLRDLNVIHGELAHGTEIIWSRRKGMSEQDLMNWVSTREELGVFAAD